MEDPIRGTRSSWPSAQAQETPSRSFKLRKLLLRYYPPGIILEYEDQEGALQQSSLDLLNLDADTDVEVQEPFIFFQLRLRVSGKIWNEHETRSRLFEWSWLNVCVCIV